MTLYEFSLLCRQRQTDLLYKHGVYVGKHSNGAYAVVLYQFESFYVEITYRKYRSLILDLKCFASTEKLAPYLQLVDIEELVKCVG